MRIGYPCINRSIGCTASRTFRLRSYAPERLVETVAHNLACLERMLAYNAERGILFLRISSDVVPFASHPVCRVDWPRMFAQELRQIGRFIRRHGMRISMHPDQFVLLNALDPTIVASSIAEVRYHAQFLDAMGLGTDAKIQLHVGGAYGDKAAGMDRCAAVYRGLDRVVRRRLVFENDDVRYTLRDCLRLSERTGAPVLFDILHHRVNCSGERDGEALRLAAATWGPADGPPMIDYSSQARGARKGRHAATLDAKDFCAFLRLLDGMDADIMLEIKDKEISALKALRIAGQRPAGDA